MKNIFYIIIIGLTVFITSCDEPGSSILFDENFIELDAATTVTKQRIFTYLRINDGAGVPSGFKVNLGARQKSTPVTFTFEILPSSTAIENLHYTVESFSVTIPPNTSVVELPITILDDNIDGGELYTIVVRIQGTDVPAHELYSEGTHLIQVSCPVPNDFMVGNYAITYDQVTAPFGPLPLGPEGKVFAVSNANVGATFKRSFSFVHLETGGFGNGAVTAFLELNCEQIILEKVHAGLACAGGVPTISLGPSDENGFYDGSDDSSFTVIYNEFIDDGGCGVPPIKQIVRFIKQ